MSRYAYDADTLGPYVEDPLKHYGLAVTVARKFRSHYLTEDDLVQEALAALCAAARNYQPDKGATFATWATILMTAHLKGVTLYYHRVGSFGGRGTNSTFVPSVRKYLQSNLNPDMSLESLQKLFDHVQCSKSFSDYDWSTLSGHAQHMELSLDEPVITGGEDSTASRIPLVETIEDVEGSDRDEQRDCHLDRESILNRFSDDPREQDILRSRIFSENPDNLEELGQRWGVTRERIRQIETELRKSVQVKLTFGVKSKA